MTTIDPRFAQIVDRVRSDEQALREARAAKRDAEREALEAKRQAERQARAVKARKSFEDRFIAAVTEQQNLRKWSVDTFVEAVSYASALIMTNPDTEIPEVTSQVAEAVHRAFAFSIIQTRFFQDLDHYVGQRAAWYPDWQKQAAEWFRKEQTKKSSRPKTAELKHSTSTGDKPSDETAEAHQPTETMVDDHLTTSVGALAPQLREAITPPKKGASRKTGHSKSGSRKGALTRVS